MRQKALQQLLTKTHRQKITEKNKIVIFSDLHLGNSTRRDDFKKNASLFCDVLEKHYLVGGYSLILNGDVEELQKFSLRKILAKWSRVYDLFAQFESRGRLHKIIGNHDFGLPTAKDYPCRAQLKDALLFSYKSNSIFIFHGHQASNLIEKYNTLAGHILRFVVKPIGFKNATTAYNSKRKYRVEKQVYKFGVRNKIICIIGHTHRPLFDSLSKEEMLKFKIERLILSYPNAEDKKAIAKEIRALKKALQKLVAEEPKDRNSLYDAAIVNPVLFNSGCVIGKRGMTAIEIEGGEIRLVYWFNKKRKQKHISIFEEGPFPLGDSNYRRMVLKKEKLDYIFTRIKLLSE